MAKKIRKNPATRQVNENITRRKKSVVGMTGKQAKRSRQKVNRTINKWNPF